MWAFGGPLAQALLLPSVVNELGAGAQETVGVVPRIEGLIEGLRQELFQYGEVLALLDQQQQSLTNYANQEVWGCMLRLQREMTGLEKVWSQRQEAWLELARALGGPEDMAVSALLARLPEKYRLPVEALLEENTDLLGRVRHCTRHNLILLGHVVQSLQQFQAALDRQPLASPPERPSQPATSPSPFMWEAVA
jgi:hypothetical protein